MAFQSGDSSSSSSSSSPSIRSWNHDVFLSFRGEDVRHNFISHLYQALDQRGINTYIDNNLERGEEISPTLFKAIEGSMISIIVISSNYAKSKWCLDELLKILDCKETMKQIVLPIFYHVDPSEVRHQKGIFGKSFEKLGDKLKDNTKMVEWREALKRVADLSGFPLVNFRKESEFIQEIIQWVDFRMVNQTPLSVAKFPIGIESRMRNIYKHLSIGKNDITLFVGIFGTGGIGKTTLAKDIYNRISSQFEGSCFLKDVRETSKQAGGIMKLQNILLYDILGISLDVHDIDRGINVIRHRLCSKRVLLILDDVDELVLIENLAGDRDWFGLGSRIIITTRDQRLLENSKVDSKHEVMILDDNEALQLFSLHAFEEKEPLKDYIDLCKQVTKYAQGLPLALTVLGSDLKGQHIHQWKIALNKYKKIPNSNIQKVLLVSYEGLDDTEREIFLDIAFFFKGQCLANLVKILDNSGFYPVQGIKRLTDKCLITIESERVWMHDLLQDMGREIVRLESPKEPSKRSRLWFHEDIREVLEKSTGPNKIEGILIDLPEEDEEISLHPEAFRHMQRLRVFINHNACFSCAPNYLSDELRVFDWYNYPIQSLPHDFQGKKLIIFRMHNSLIKELGDGFKPKILTSMSFTNCEFLKKIPDLSSVSNLKELMVTGCNRLVEVHDSVGSLKNLCELNFFGCSQLQILPRSLNLKSLSLLHLSYCSSLRYLPEIECKMESLIQLDLSKTAIEDLPLSIENMVGLEYLNLSECKNLVRLPNSTCVLFQHLEELEIRDCRNLVSLPTSIKELVTLKRLYLQDCVILEEIVELPPNIQIVDVTGCISLEKFLEISKILEFNGSYIRSLRRIMLDGCNKMHENIWNARVQNPLLWKGVDEYDATLFPENQIPKWWSYIYQFLKDNEMVNGRDDYVKSRKEEVEEEWAIDIKGPHDLEEINGIVLYVVTFFNYAKRWDRTFGKAKITSNNSNHVCYIQQEVQLLNRGFAIENDTTGYAIWVGYSDLQAFERKILDNLRVQFDFHPPYDRLVCFYKSRRAKVAYKNEMRAIKKRKIYEVSRSPLFL